MSRKSGVWYWELWKFGSTQTAIGHTREECVKTMSEEYIKTYAKWNDLDETKCRDALLSPILDEDGEVDEYDAYNEFAECYRSNFIEFNDGEPEFVEFGKVVWR